MPGIIVIGLQWGDEGKGKIVDLLAESASHVVRSHGGSNAGHTVQREGGSYAFHLIPSGVLYPHTHCYIGAGTAIEPPSLIEEIQKLEGRGISLEGRLWISPYAQVVFSFHRQLDKLYEQLKGSAALGTTGRGIGPCYQDRAARIGVRIAELIAPVHLKDRLAQLVEMKNLELQKLFNAPALDFDSLYKEYAAYGERLKKYVGDVEGRLAAVLKRDENVLFEGAHGSLLDVTFGTVPYVTSSSAIAAGVCMGAGVGTSAIDETLGVVKAYTTRVGAGPLPTALSEEELKNFLSCEEAREIGTTTGRKRRIGWFDAPLVRFTAQISGVDLIALTKLDVLDKLEHIKVCVGYRLDGQVLEKPPVLTEDFTRLEPIYEVLEGWCESTSSVKTWKGLPSNARRYLERVEELIDLPIHILSVGPDHNQTLFVEKGEFA